MPEWVRPVPFRRSIRAKLIGLTAIVIGAIVAILTVYFPRQQLDEMRSQQQRRAESYAALLAKQARSAVAFSDRETAREVLSSIETDPDVASATLYDASGQTLYQSGVPSTWVGKARRGVTSPRLVTLHDRVASVVPVVSLEGPQGTLIIELSSAALVRHQWRVIATSVAVAAIVLAFGIFAAVFIARSLVRRLRVIGDVAIAVATGTSKRRKVTVTKRDEIGVVASAFNYMLEQLEDEQAKLEQRVAERTAELRGEMLQRSHVEIQLRQAQKLESVGRLAAGVAHEINTPIQFVGDSVQFISESIEDLLTVVNATDVQELSRAREQADVGFLSEELPLAAARAAEGLQRVAAIVASLKMFSQPQSRMTSVDLNRAIASTLTIARNEYKYVADVVTEYGELPLVHCHQGEVNQAILNIILNASHAIRDVVRGTDRRGTITITTRCDGDQAVISIRDTGSGIPDSVRERIFEPFFTTKRVGEGTGQGLAIAHSVIVEKHHGELTFDSELGVGTTFHIHLPIAAQRELEQAA